MRAWTLGILMAAGLALPVHARDANTDPVDVDCPLDETIVRVQEAMKQVKNVRYLHAEANAVMFTYKKTRIRMLVKPNGKCRSTLYVNFSAPNFFRTGPVKEAYKESMGAVLNSLHLCAFKECQGDLAAGEWGETSDPDRTKARERIRQRVTGQGDPPRKGKKKKEPFGLMWNLQDVLGEGWDVPPELTSRPKEGSVIRLLDSRVQVTKSQCLSGRAEEHETTTVDLKKRLEVGGEVPLGAVQVGASGKIKVELKLTSPFIRSYEVSALKRLTPACQEAVREETARGGHGQVLVEEALYARVSGCEELGVRADISIGRRSIGLEGSKVCSILSKEPIVIGIRTRPVQ